MLKYRNIFKTSNISKVVEVKGSSSPLLNLLTKLCQYIQVDTPNDSLQQVHYSLEGEFLEGNAYTWVKLKASCLQYDFHIQSCALLNWKYFRFRCGCTPITVNWFLSLFHHFLQYLWTLYIVWSLVRRRVTRRLTRLQTMHNVLKYIKTF